MSRIIEGVLCYDWDDVDAGICPATDIWRPAPADGGSTSLSAPPLHPLTAGLDLAHPDADRTILRRLYHADPQAFLNAYGTAGVNKLMDLAVKENAGTAFPSLDDHNGWNKLAADVARAIRLSDYSPTNASNALILGLCHEAGGSLAALRKLIDHTE